MAGQFATLNRHVAGSQAQLAGFENQLKRIKTMALFGGVALGVGGAGLFALKAPLEEAKAWQQEAARFASLGFGVKVNQDAQQFAKGMQTYGTSARDNLTLLSDAMAVFKNLHDAQIAAPIMAKMKFANEAVFGKEGAGTNEGKFMDMLKVIELRRGLSSQEEFARQANYVQQVIAGSRGRVDASQLLMALKTGGVGISQFSNDAFYLGSEPLIQEFGGFRYGTAINSIYSNLVQGRGSMTAQQELFRLGLLNPKKVEFNRMGMLKKALPGSFLGGDVFEKQGPLALLQDVLLPAFAKKGITSDQGIIDELGRILSNRTASGLLARAYQQRGTILNQWNANRNAQNIDQLAETGKNTPAGKTIELGAQYRNLMLELGTAVLPIAIKAVGWLSSAIKEAVHLAREFPLLTKGIVLTFGTLAALVATGGAITLATAGIKALQLALGVSSATGIGAGLVGSLGAVATGIGWITAAAATFTAAYAATRWIANKITPDDWTLGGQIYDWTHKSYDPNAKPGSRFVAGGKSGSVLVHTQINMDGRKFAETLTKHQENFGQAPQVGLTGFDWRKGLLPAGGTGGF